MEVKYEDYMNEYISEQEFEETNKIDNDKIAISEVEFDMYQFEI